MDVTETRFNIVFRGDTTGLISPEQSKQNFANLFNKSVAQIEYLFTGKASILKKSVDQKTAAGLISKLQKCGLVAVAEQVIIRQTPVSSPSRPLGLVPVVDTASSDVPKESVKADDRQADANDRSHTSSVMSVVSVNFEKGKSIFMCLLGVALFGSFFPVPDLVIKKGFVLGVFLVGYGIYRFKRA